MFNEHNLTTNFIELSPLIEEYKDFFELSNGALFITFDPSIDKLYPDASLLPLTYDSEFSMPVYFAYRTGHKEDLSFVVLTRLIKASSAKEHVITRAREREPA